MITSVARYAPSIVAGSALAGFGLSFGRSAYKKSEKAWPFIIILLCLVGVYFSGMWLFRNYRTLAGSVFKRIGALICLLLSFIGGYFGSTIIGVIVLPTVSPDILLIGIAVGQGAIFLMGAIVGISHRRKRREAWEAEEHNKDFLSIHGLDVIDSDKKGNIRLRDQTEDVGYRMMEDLEIAGELEFMALGKRNKRGYMQYDDTGKYTRWSGMVDVR